MWYGAKVVSCTFTAGASAATQPMENRGGEARRTERVAQ